jgi:hypothetical protein
VIAKAGNNVTILQVAEIIDGPIENRLKPFYKKPKQKFGKNADRVCQKAIAGAKAVLAKQKIANLMK